SFSRDWSSDVCSSDLVALLIQSSPTNCSNAFAVGNPVCDWFCIAHKLAAERAVMPHSDTHPPLAQRAKSPHKILKPGANALLINEPMAVAGQAGQIYRPPAKKQTSA